MKSALDAQTIQADLSAWAWEKCEEASRTGKVTLQDGTAVDLLDPSKEGQNIARTLLTHIRWHASLSAKKRARTEMPRGSDDFRLPETA